MLRLYEDMDTINIFDRNFMPYSESSTLDKTPKSFKYVKNHKNFDGITIFTDHFFDMVNHVKSKFNVAWQVESPVHSNKHFYSMLKVCSDKYDMIFTYDEELVKSNPKKFKRCNFGGTTVKDIHARGPHLKGFCIIHSGKKDTPNHALRQRIINELSERYNIDVFGRVTGKPFDNIAEIYHNYKYPIVIENINHPNYFSEKLTDALACGCVPLYNGSSLNSDDYINKEGIINWNSWDELVKLLQTLDQGIFDDALSDRIDNCESIYKYYYTNEDWLYEHYLKHIKL